MAKRDFFKEPSKVNPQNRKICVELSEDRCQACGSKIGVAAHHIKFKSDRIDDSLWNLISLCFHCHRKAHDGIYIDKDGKSIFISARNWMIKVLIALNCKRYEKSIEYLRSITDEV